MLKSLEIKNVALIDNIIIDFSKNLNVLTGETGAGKSIIIDSVYRQTDSPERKGKKHEKTADRLHFPRLSQKPDRYRGNAPRAGGCRLRHHPRGL